MVLRCPPVRPGLCAEAIRLGRLLVALMPNEGEAIGLLALMLLHDSRRAARVDDEGRLVLLGDQDRSRWDRDAIAEGETLYPATKDAQQAVITKTDGKDGWKQIVASGDALQKAPFQSVDNYPQWKDQIATPAFQQFLAGKTDAAGLQKALTDGWATVNR